MKAKILNPIRKGLQVLGDMEAFYPSSSLVEAICVSRQFFDQHIRPLISSTDEQKDGRSILFRASAVLKICERLAEENIKKRRVRLNESFLQ
jgi:hypothetical protein